jgi:hypothetical protein
MVRETEMAREKERKTEFREGDEGRHKYLKEDGDIEKNNALCVTGRHRPNSVHF